MADDKGAQGSGQAAEETTGEAPPALDEKIRAEVQAMGQQLRESRVRGQRSLFIHVLLMFLVSIVVFVVGTYFFVVPRVIRQSLDNQQLQLAIAGLEKRLNRAEQAIGQLAASRDEPAPAPTAEPAPAPKAEPAPAPKAEPAPAPKADAAK